jgi:hypothetical protein
MGSNTNVLDSFDDFGDFEAAPQSPSLAPLAQAQVQSQAPLQLQAPPTGKGNLFDLLGQNGSASAGGGAGSMAHARQLSGGMMPGMTSPTSPGFNMNAGMGMSMGMGGNMGGRPMMSPTTVNAPQRTSSFASAGTPLGSPPLQAQPQSAQASKTPTTGGKSSVGGFEDLWSMSLGSSGTQKKAAPAGNSKSMQELEREKVQNKLWGAPTITNNLTPKSAAQPSNSGFGNNFGSSGDDNLLL